MTLVVSKPTCPYCDKPRSARTRPNKRFCTPKHRWLYWNAVHAKRGGHQRKRAKEAQVVIGRGKAKRVRHLVLVKGGRARSIAEGRK